MPALRLTLLGEIAARKNPPHPSRRHGRPPLPRHRPHSTADDDRSRLQQLHELSRAAHASRCWRRTTCITTIHRAAPLQDVLTCVRHGCTIHEAGFKLFPNGERYLKSPEQMHRLFDDYPQAIQRGIEIAERCTFRSGRVEVRISRRGRARRQDSDANISGELAWSRGRQSVIPTASPKRCAS